MVKKKVKKVVKKATKKKVVKKVVKKVSTKKKVTKKKTAPKKKKVSLSVQAKAKKERAALRKKLAQEGTKFADKVSLPNIVDEILTDTKLQEQVSRDVDKIKSQVFQRGNDDLKPKTFEELVGDTDHLKEIRDLLLNEHPNLKDVYEGKAPWQKRETTSEIDGGLNIARAVTAANNANNAKRDEVFGTKSRTASLKDAFESVQNHSGPARSIKDKELENFFNAKANAGFSRTSDEKWYKDWKADYKTDYNEKYDQPLSGFGRQGAKVARGSLYGDLETETGKEFSKKFDEELAKDAQYKLENLEEKLSLKLKAMFKARREVLILRAALENAYSSAVRDIEHVRFELGEDHKLDDLFEGKKY